MLWTEAAFSACLAWHWPDHHWQCNWRVVWTSSRMCAGKGGHFHEILWQYSALYQETFQFFLNVARFLDVFLEITTNSKFCGWGSAATYWRCGGKCYMSFVGYLLVFSAVKEFSRSVKNWQSYRHEFGVLLCLGHSVDTKQCLQQQQLFWLC